jgi:CarboxypepD_reg-like domain
MNYREKLIAIAFLIFTGCSHPLIAQSVIYIAGKIVDNTNENPLGYATVSLKGKGIGTVSNTDGEFEFHIPEGHLRDTLQISMLGYVAIEKVISSIEPGKPLKFNLKESIIQLKEVVINSMSANDIFKKAYQNLTKTFLQENYLLKGFYRQINTENEKNVFLVEAAVSIFDNKTQLHNNFRLREKVSVNQMRFSNSLFKNTDPNYFENSNTLAWLLLFDYTKYRNKYVMARTNFVLDSIVDFNQRSFYVIRSKVTPKELTNTFTLYIDTEDFSFLKIKNETVANKGYYLQNFNVYTDQEKKKVLKLTASSQTYQFKRHKGKMYLEHAHSYSKGEIINTNTGAIEWNVTDESLLVINEVITDKVKAPESGLMDDKNIKFNLKPYDAQAWSNYKLVNLIPLTRKQRLDLEQSSPLEEQFNKHK